MKIEIGKYYRSATGSKVGPIKVLLSGGSGQYKFHAVGEHRTSQLYNEFGKADDGPEFDLVAEWVDEPQIEVGKTYPDRDNRKWACLFIRDGIAFMQLYGGGDAYRYKLDGTPISFGSNDEWTIDLGPARGEVVKYFSEARDVAGYQHADSKYKATIPTLDGKPAAGTYTGENGLCVKIEEVE
jgi:hypothetical protein